MAIQATMANLKRYHAKHGDRLMMFSPYTGEQYSANPGDYLLRRHLAAKYDKMTGAAR